MTVSKNLSSIAVIFGGTGDLTHRKLIPAFYNLFREEKLPEHFAMVSIGRKMKTASEYLQELYESIHKYSRFDVVDKIWECFKEKIHYFCMEFSDEGAYDMLKKHLAELDTTCQTMGNRIYYLAVAPSYFEVIVNNLHVNGMAENKQSWQRLVIEKPFGSNLTTARFLNSLITDVFGENRVYRIDHYLGKEMIQNIMVIRFANAMFENIWDARYIDSIQISFCETVGVESRGGYYEKSGALRDMFQNHVLQLLALTAMEPPEDLQTESIRDEKVKLLKSISLEGLDGEGTLNWSLVRGQYGRGEGDTQMVGYRQEERVDSESDTETYLALKMFISNDRWKNMPFYIRTGKRMPEKSTDIVVEFKQNAKGPYFQQVTKEQPNLLVIRIQPREGMSFVFHGKKPGTGNEIQTVMMDYCQNCQNYSNSPEAYERLLLDVVRGDLTLFTRWDEIEESWKLVDGIAAKWQSEKPDFPNYPAGTWGPKLGEDLLTRDGRHWWNIKEE